SLMSKNNQAQIVDVSHRVSPFQIQEAAYILSNAFATFPKGSVHIIDVDSYETPEKTHKVIFAKGHYFIACDNGIFSLMFDPDEVEEVYELTFTKTAVDYEKIFPAISVFSAAAAHISGKGPLSIIGRKVDSFFKTHELENRIMYSGTQLRTYVIYIDRFGNVIFGLKKNEFTSHANGRPFVMKSFKKGTEDILLEKNKSIKTKITKIHKHYSEVSEGSVVALFNTAEHLELAINRHDANSVGGAALILGLKYGDYIQIEFS
ncbi:MAG: SAM hydrolase/SAM-dependent halogenase family protein, partial [Flavobacteriales bacterium]